MSHLTINLKKQIIQELLMSKQEELQVMQAFQRQLLVAKQQTRYAHLAGEIDSLNQGLKQIEQAWLNPPYPYVFASS